MGDFAVFTGYFAKTSFYLEKGLEPVSVALYPPKGWGHRSCPTLSPTPEILASYKANPDTTHYRKDYFQLVLGHLNPDTVFNQLTRHNQARAILLCYESPDKFCHRHLIAEWLGFHGYHVKEFQADAGMSPLFD